MKLSKVGLIAGLILGTTYIPVSASSIPDLGHSRFPRARIDINNDGRIDFCRFVGDTPNVYIACDVGSTNQYAYKSKRKIDGGYSNRYRGFTDINGDGYGDYCRYVGSDLNIEFSCMLGRKYGFDNNQHTIRYKR